MDFLGFLRKFANLSPWREACTAFFGCQCPMETLLTCHLVGGQTPLLCSLAPQPCRVLRCFSNQMGERSSPQLCEELGLVGLKAALLVLTVFPEHNTFSSWSYHPLHWAQDLFLSLRGKVCATESLPLCSPVPSSSVSPLSSKHACINMSYSLLSRHSS